MKTKALMILLLLGGLTAISSNAFAQTSTISQDSVREAEKVKDQQDKQRLDNAVDLRRSTRADAKSAKAQAKEANRIQDDASDAAREAKQAARTESKAQKAREQADKQARKAARASDRSNSNK